MDTGSFLSLRDVTKDYGDRRILDRVDLDVDEGDFCTIVGPSGCGKSTLLRLVLGEEEPTSGTVSIDGTVDGYADSRRGIVYQKYSLYPHLTVLGNVLLGPRLHARRWRSEKAAATAEAMRFLERVHLADSCGKYPHELSGGMQQRVAIVQAMITRPKVLLMDEPFAALDPPTREELQMFTLELWQESKTTIFFVTHDVTEALFLGTRIMLLSQHFIQADGDVGKTHGARIVLDQDLDRAIFRVSDKNSTAFREMRDRIMRSGFSPDHMLRSDAFDLRHPRPFVTPPKAEAA
jgi:NitT/TauT family transport system ATP-binding protein